MDPSGDKPPQHPSKKCPYCHVYLKPEDKRCFSCHRRVGSVNRLGIARKPFNWVAYLVCILSWTAFGLYVWWAFFRK